MKIILFPLIYLLFFLTSISILLIEKQTFLNYFSIDLLLFETILIGGYGGVLYCLRGIYINYSHRKQWDSDWLPWYIIRPFVSMMSGGISFLLLKTGLLILDTNQGENSIYTYYLLALISGLNVDNFIIKIEQIAKSTFGINESNTSKSKIKEELKDK